MFFAIIQDTDRSDNPPFAACGATLDEVAGKVCAQMHGAYEMPTHITTLEAAAAWFSGVVEDGEEQYEEGAAYNCVYWWDTTQM